MIPMEGIFKRLRFEIGDAEIMGRMPGLLAGVPFDEGRIDFLNRVSKELLGGRHGA